MTKVNMNLAVKMYTDYIMKHRQGVIDTWQDILRPVLVKEHVSKDILESIDQIVLIHDYEKLNYLVELLPYAKHFYYPEQCKKDSVEYRKAWHHHQKHAKHHWQYWVLLEDIENPKVVALEMDFESVMEMLCDWQSASNHYGNTAHWWYETQKDNMILHPSTRKLVEKYLKYLN